jgi:hypothetical protein
VVVHFRYPTASAADQKLGRVRVRLALDATDKRGQPLDAVHEALLLQEFERAIHGGRGRRSAMGAQAVEQLVRADRPLRIEDQSEDLPPQVRQPRPALMAELRRSRQQLRRLRSESRLAHPGSFLSHRIDATYAAMTSAAILDEIAFDADGLVPAIAQQHDSGEVLMLAWMNRDAVAETLATGRVCYSSRGRGKLWRKGEISGQTQRP